MNTVGWQKEDQISINSLKIMEQPKFQKELKHYRKRLNRAVIISKEQVEKEYLREMEQAKEKVRENEIIEEEIKEIARTKKLRSEILAGL